MEPDFEADRTSIGSDRRRHRQANTRISVFSSTLSARVPDWRRIRCLLAVFLPCAILGVYQVHLGVNCYLGASTSDDMEVILDRKKRCVMVDVDSLAVTAALLGILFLMLATCSILGAVLLYKIKPSEDDDNESVTSEKESIIEV